MFAQLRMAMLPVGESVWRPWGVPRTKNTAHKAQHTQQSTYPQHTKHSTAHTHTQQQQQSTYTQHTALHTHTKQSTYTQHTAHNAQHRELEVLPLRPFRRHCS